MSWNCGEQSAVETLFADSFLSKEWVDITDPLVVLDHHDFVNFSHLLRVTQSHIRLLEQLGLLSIDILLHLLETQGNAHILKEESLGHGTPRQTFLVGFGNDADLLEINVRRQIHLSNLRDDVFPVLDELVVFNCPERVAESMVFSVVDNHGCTFRHLD